GESDTPPPGYRWEECGADLAAFLDALSLERVEAVGHSKGATAIAAAAAAGTTRVARAVLIEPVLFAGPIASAPIFENPLAAGAMRRREVWPSRAALFEALRPRMPFETWQEGVVRFHRDARGGGRPAWHGAAR